MQATTFTPNPDLFPFESRWFETSVGPMHYIDEGEGRPIVLMHGNPDWSFLYRRMIPTLNDAGFRTIAMDYPGFGLSSHPPGYDYLPSTHGRVVTELIEHLDINDAVLVGQDWGGPIGMDVASRSADRFTGLVMGNTFYFPSTFFMQRMFSRLMGTKFMQRQLRKRHLFVKRFMPMLLQVEMSDEEFRHYIDTAPHPDDRAGHAIFPKAILGESTWLADVERRVTERLSDRPMLLVMGMKDKPLTSKAVQQAWAVRWPNATWLRLPKAGHYWQEDDPEAVTTAIIAKHGR